MRPAAFQELSAQLVNASGFTSGDFQIQPRPPVELAPVVPAPLMLISGRAGRAPGCMVGLSQSRQKGREREGGPGLAEKVRGTAELLWYSCFDPSPMSQREVSVIPSEERRSVELCVSQNRNWWCQVGESIELSLLGHCRTVQPSNNSPVCTA